jgi:hypothetical protein
MKIPEDQPETTLHQFLNRVVWKLTVCAEFPGEDYFVEFELPVLANGTHA